MRSNRQTCFTLNLPDIKSHIASFFDDDYWKPVIEAADDKEIAMIEEGMNEYYANPKSFKSWSEIRRKYTPKKI
jgi:hypothetical protein